MWKAQANSRADEKALLCSPGPSLPHPRPSCQWLALSDTSRAFFDCLVFVLSWRQCHSDPCTFPCALSLYHPKLLGPPVWAPAPLGPRPYTLSSKTRAVSPPLCLGWRKCSANMIERVDLTSLPGAYGLAQKDSATVWGWIFEKRFYCVKSNSNRIIQPSMTWIKLETMLKQVSEHLLVGK